MGSGMNRAQAEEYAKTMTYKQAIGNIRTGKGIVYKKATMVKLHELAEIADKLVLCKDCKHSHMTYDGRCKYCDKWEEDGEALYLEGDFYCAFGKRREDGEA